MGVFHIFELTKDETKYFRYTNGTPAEISRSEYQNTGIHTTISGYALSGGRGATVGAAWTRSGSRIIYAAYEGRAVFALPLNGRATTLITLDGSLIEADVTTSGLGGGEGGAQTETPGGAAGVDFGGVDGQVPAPDVAAIPAAAPALPAGNGNNGFQSSLAAGAQTGITGGNAP
jgi:hypothetical protein